MDPIFEHPRLVSIYDALDPDRRDLEVYADITRELGARTVLDVGCGTGTFALLLADRGLDVVGLDPAAGSLAVARGKSGAHRVRWSLVPGYYGAYLTLLGLNAVLPSPVPVAPVLAL